MYIEIYIFDGFITNTSLQYKIILASKTLYSERKNRLVNFFQFKKISLSLNYHIIMFLLSDKFVVMKLYVQALMISHTS